MATQTRGNAVIGQSGGPTAVINQSLVGVVEALRGAGHVHRLLGGTSTAATARHVGVDRRTIFRWMRDCEPFRSELARRRRELWHTAGDRLRALVGQSLTILQDQLADTWEPTRFRAAVALVRLAQARMLVEAQLRGVPEPEPPPARQSPAQPGPQPPGDAGDNPLIGPGHPL